MTQQLPGVEQKGAVLFTMQENRKKNGMERGVGLADQHKRFTSNGRTIRLRKLKEDDLDMVMRWRMMPEVSRYMFTDPTLTPELQKRWFGQVENDSSCWYWIIEVDSIDIGVLGITAIDLNAKECNWNWYIGELAYRGLGIASVIQLNLYDYLFDGLGMERLYSEVLAENLPNLRAYAKCEYYPERILKNYVKKNGEYHDVYLCSITRRKWNDIESNYQYDSIIIEDKIQ